MTEFTARTKEDVVHELGILPSDFIHAGAKDRLTMLACLTPEQAFRLGHVLGFGKGQSAGYIGAANICPSGPTGIRANGELAEARYAKQWHLKKEGE